MFVVASWSRPVARAFVVSALCAGLAQCGAARVPDLTPVVVTDDQKLEWILRLEDQRLLRDPSLPLEFSESASAADEAETASPVAGESVAVRMTAATPDLLRLVEDPLAAVRRRAALAIGRVGLVEGVPALVTALEDVQPEVRGIAAFSLGLIGAPEAIEPLLGALQDGSPVVQGRAAWALSRLGGSGAVEAIQTMVASHVTEAYGVDPEDLGYPLEPRVEAFRSGVYALGVLGSYEALSDILLTDDGDPILWWWPVVHAFSQVGDVRAAGPLRTLAGIQGSFGVSEAARGLGVMRNGDPETRAALVALLDFRRRDLRVVTSAVRALGDFGDEAAEPALRELLRTPDLPPNLLLEVVEALGAIGATGSTDVMVELLAHSWTPVRGAALRGLARLDPDLFLFVLSGMPADSDWSVRADLARALVNVDPEVAASRLTPMLEDADQRVVPDVLRSLVAVQAPNAVAALRERLSASDIVVRQTAVSLLGEYEGARAIESLVTTYHDSLADSSYLVRAAVVDALGRIGNSSGVDTLRTAVEDPDWAVRLRAAEHLQRLDPSSQATNAIRPAPLRRPLDAYGDRELITPTVSPHVFLDTDRGTIQIELAVNEAPLTSNNFMHLARSGFYDGLLVHRVIPNYSVQAGDPRSDGQGGPGYTIRDELSPLPYLRGTVGMALDWADTGGSQFFITTSPQPQLDGRYTAFGQVIGGIEVVDELQRGDVIRQVRVWDGVAPP